MGAWGIKALESDEGLDMIGILTDEYLSKHSILNLDEILELMKQEGMLGEDLSDIDFLYDNTAMALAELYFQWKTIFYKGIMPSEKVLDFPVDCNTLTGSVNL